MEIGAQLYNVREFCKTVDGIAMSLKKIADMGYKNVQMSGVCDFDAQWLKEELAANGLRAVLTHTAPKRIIGETEKVCDEHITYGCKYIGIGGYMVLPEHSLESFVAEFTGPAKYFRDHGCYFMYHNHDHEFKKINGRLVIEQLMESIPADLMGITVDTYWVQHAGADPAQWLEKFAGRIPTIHLKDFAYGPKMVPIGEGNINFDRVFAAAEKGGTEYMIVEQDNSNGEDPFDCLRRSYDYLHACGFE